jgi:threonine synthase
MTTTFINPYPMEGNKTISYEIIESLAENVPAWILSPVGVGPMLVRICRGLLDLKRLGIIKN